MHRNFLRSALTALVCATVLAVASPAMAQTVNLKADLKGTNEVPPNDTKGSGSVTATYNPSTKQLSWRGSYTGTTGPATAAHFHSGESGKNGGIVLPIFQGAAAKSPFEGTATLTDAQATEVLAGKWYVNVHTDVHKPGELRGQLTK